jgi:hypothetical protein
MRGSGLTNRSPHIQQFWAVYPMNDTLMLPDKPNQIRQLAAQIAIEQDQGRFTALLKIFNDLVDPLHPPQPQPPHPPTMLPWPK